MASYNGVENPAVRIIRTVKKDDISTIASCADGKSLWISSLKDSHLTKVDRENGREKMKSDKLPGGIRGTAITSTGTVLCITLGNTDISRVDDEGHVSPFVDSCCELYQCIYCICVSAADDVYIFVRYKESYSQGYVIKYNQDGHEVARSVNDTFTDVRCITCTGGALFVVDRDNNTNVLKKIETRQDELSVTSRNELTTDTDLRTVTGMTSDTRGNLYMCDWYDSLYVTPDCGQTLKPLWKPYGDIWSYVHFNNGHILVGCDQGVIVDVTVSVTDDELDRYLKQLEEGWTYGRNIRLMVLGNQRNGKTSLCRNLLKDTCLGNVKDGTNGVEIYQFENEIDMTTGKLTKKSGDVETAIKTTLTKLAGTIISKEAKQYDSGVHTTKDDPADAAALFPCGSNAGTQVLVNPEVAAEHLQKGHVESEDDTNDPSIVASKQVGVDGDKPIHIDRAAAVLDNTASHIGGQMKKGNRHVIKDKEVQHVLGKEGKIDKNKAYLSVWDFGGEEIFYSTHHMFLSSDSEFCVVFKLVGFDKTIVEVVRFWLRTISSYATDADTDMSQKSPPIFMVATHMREFFKQYKTEKEAKRKIESMYAEIFDDPEMQKIKPKICGFYEVENLNCNHQEKLTFKTLLSDIVEHAKYQKQWNKPIPAKWFLLERDIMKEKGKGTNMLTLQQVIDLDQATESPIGDLVYIKDFLRSLHLTGYVMFFDEEQSKDTSHIIINPQWLVNAFRCIITPEKFRRNAFVNHERSSLKRGAITKNLIRAAFEGEDEAFEGKDKATPKIKKSIFHRLNPFTRKDNQCDRTLDGQFKEHLDTLIWFMERFGLIAKISRSLDTATCLEEDTHYIVPALLTDNVSKKSLDKIFDKTKKDVVSTCTLVLKSQQPEISSFVFNKLQAFCLQKYKKAEPTILEDALLKDFGCFQHESSDWYFCIHHTALTLRITMFRFNETDKSIPDGVGRKLLHFIEKIIQTIFQKHGHESQLNEFNYSFCSYPCDTQTYNKEDIDTWTDNGEKRCGEGKVRKKDMFHWFTSAENQHVEASTKLWKPQFLGILTDIGLMNLARKLGEQWEMIASSLGLTKAEIYMIKEDNKHSCLNQIHTALISWRDTTVRDQQLSEQQILDKLVSALKDNERQDIVDEIKVGRLTW